jgi:hypothetical protein
VPHDAGIQQQALHICLAERCHLLSLKIGKCSPKILALVQNSQPAQTCLKTFEADFFEKPTLVIDRKAPLGVVVVAVRRCGLAPGAAMGVGIVCKQAGCAAAAWSTCIVLLFTDGVVSVLAADQPVRNYLTATNRHENTLDSHDQHQELETIWIEGTEADVVAIPDGEKS